MGTGGKIKITVAREDWPKIAVNLFGKSREFLGEKKY